MGARRGTRGSAIASLLLVRCGGVSTRGSAIASLLLVRCGGVSQWTQLGGDVDGEAANYMSGWSVALSADGTRLAVGAIFNDGVNGDNSGHARVYDVCSTNEPTPTPTRSTTTPTR